MSETPVGNCRNCGAELAGPFCARCGQNESREDLHFADAAGDILLDAFDWDSRVWRTLVPLVVRPGFLTAEFVAGRRARYLPPFRLYLIISFLLFFMLSLSTGDLVSINDDVVEGAAAEARDNAVVVTPEIVDALPDDATAELEETGAVTAAPVDSEDADAVDSDADKSGDEGEGLSINIFPSAPGGETAEWARQLEQRIEVNARAVRKDPRDYVESLMEHLPQAMFLMLPIFALLLRFVYIASPFHYLQHLVFALHYHSFVYLFYLMMMGVDRLSLPGTDLYWLILPAYLPLALRRAYGSSLAGAIGRSLLVYLTYTLVLVLVLAAAALLTLAFI